MGPCSFESRGLESPEAHDLLPLILRDLRASGVGSPAETGGRSGTERARGSEADGVLGVLLLAVVAASRATAHGEVVPAAAAVHAPVRDREVGLARVLGPAHVGVPAE